MQNEKNSKDMVAAALQNLKTPEAYEEAAIRAVNHNRPDDAAVFSNLAIAKAIARLTDTIHQQEK
ncbi:hypothetical protein [Amycolatopsis sp. cmx-11-12]|uniref:hypothetical protein n=1 Tax=Amycolatopsis sp. cmx-11-12 TaxID=2785795 RepID=UPI00391842E9